MRAPSLNQVALDVANARATDVQQREKALLSDEGLLRLWEHDLDAREKVMAELEADARKCEAESEKSASDLRVERARLEQLQEALDAQKIELERRETNVANREAAHQANVDMADARLRKKRK